MNVPLLITDNIAEVLVKIIKFTRTRQKILIRNINSIHTPGFVPKDLAVDEFSDLLHEAINEHTQNGRLLLRDTESIKFCPAGRFEVKPIIDKYAKELLLEDKNKYLELQIDKLLENMLNYRVAAELLKQKQGKISIFG